MDQLKVENNNNSVHNEPNEKMDNSADISGEKKEEVIIETRNLENLLKDLREEKRLELFRCCS